MSKWFNFVNKSEGVFDIYIYGAIVEPEWKWFDSEITPIDFKEALDKTEGAKTLNFYFNSPGGFISAGLSIYSMIKRHPANKIGHIDGVCASIAHVISMAMDKIIHPKTALVLAHKPLAGICGMFNAEDLLTFAADLDKFEAPILAAYQAKTGLKIDKLKEILAKDQFMTSEEAITLGFSDESSEEKEAETVMEDSLLTINGVKFDTREFKNFPKEHFKNVKIVSNSTGKTPKNTAIEPDYSYFKARINSNSNLFNQKGDSK